MRTNEPGKETASIEALFVRNVFLRTVLILAAGAQRQGPKGALRAPNAVRNSISKHTKD